MERERKFLLADFPPGLTNGLEIQQGYLSVGDPEIRVRVIGGKYFITRKSGEGFIREEEEVEISADVFQILWPLTVGKRIEKIRFLLAAEDEFIWEIDKYLGHLSGLFTSEVEFPDEETTPLFLPKALSNVVVADVTFDKRYKNKALAIAKVLPK